MKFIIKFYKQSLDIIKMEREKVYQENERKREYSNGVNAKVIKICISIKKFDNYSNKNELSKAALYIP